MLGVTMSMKLISFVTSPIETSKNSLPWISDTLDRFIDTKRFLDPAKIALSSTGTKSVSYVNTIMSSLTVDEVSETQSQQSGEISLNDMNVLLSQKKRPNIFQETARRFGQTLSIEFSIY